MIHILKSLSLPIFHNTLVAYVTGLGVAVLLFFVLAILRRVMRREYKRLLATDHVELIEIPIAALSRTTTLFLVCIAVFVGLQLLSISSRTHAVLLSAISILLFWQAGVWASAATTAWLDRKRNAHLAGDRAAASSIGVVAFMVKALIWVMVLLLTLQNLGIKITTLVAGLGVGGIAVALAVQNVLGDLFASLSITFDQPFFVGDFVVLDAFAGSVEHIGIKSTRLRSISGEQIIVSNADLLKSRLRNYGRMNERRILFTIGVTYDTPVEQLEEIPKMLREIIQGVAETRFDRSHFANHGNSSLDFETVYYVLSADYTKHMDIQQEIRLRIHRAFEKAGIEFAYPTQRLIVEHAGGALEQDAQSGRPVRSA